MILTVKTFSFSFITKYFLEIDNPSQNQNCYKKNKIQKQTFDVWLNPISTVNLLLPILRFCRYRHQHLTEKYDSIQLRSVQCNSVQFSSVQFSSVQFSSVQFSSVQFSSVQFSSVQFSSVQFSSVQFSSVQFSSVQFSSVQWSV